MMAADTWHPCFEAALASFCVLYAEFQANPEGFQTYRHTQLRLLGADLGLNPSTAGKVQRIG